MIRFGNPQEVEDYFADSSVSQSYLKLLLKGVDFLTEDEKKRYYEEKGHFVIGSAVDVWLTQGRENFDLQYFSFEGKKPSDAIMSIVKETFDKACFDDSPPEGDLYQYPEYVLESADSHAYSTNWKTETRINKITEAGLVYFEQLKLAFGKQILSSVESTLVQNIVMSLQSGKYTNEYFKDAPHIDIYHQVAIYFEINDIPCKALLDKVIVNRETQKIIPIDIKTIGTKTSDFPYAVTKRGYNFQGAFYTQALLKLMFKDASCPIEMNVNSDYMIEPFIFLTETTEYKENSVTGEVKFFTGKPLAFQLSPTQLNLGKYGRPEMIVNGKPENYADGAYIPIKYQSIKGFEDAINLYKWHLENGFDYDKKVIEDNGLILVE